jgi:hypothetical protein
VDVEVPPAPSVSFLPISFSAFIGTPVLPRRASSSLSAFEARPLAVQPVGLVRLVGVADVELAFQMLRQSDFIFIVEFVDRDQPFGSAGRHRSRRVVCAADLLVHHRLGERRLVALVVAEAAVAEHVDDDRLVEQLRNSVATLAA